MHRDERSARRIPLHSHDIPMLWASLFLIFRWSVILRELKNLCKFPWRNQNFNPDLNGNYAVFALRENVPHSKQTSSLAGDGSGPGRGPGGWVMPQRRWYAFTREELRWARMPRSALTHRRSFSTMDHAHPTNPHWLLSIFSLILLIFVIGERDCAGTSKGLTKGGLSDIVAVLPLNGNHCSPAFGVPSDIRHHEKDPPMIRMGLLPRHLVGWGVGVGVNEPLMENGERM